MNMVGDHIWASKKNPHVNTRLEQAYLVSSKCRLSEENMEKKEKIKNESEVHCGQPR